MPASPEACTAADIGQGWGSAGFRAWRFLLWLGIVRQARLRQMLAMALGLLILVATFVGLNTLRGYWGMHHRRWTWVAPTQTVPVLGSQGWKTAEIKPPRTVVQTYGELARNLSLLPLVAPWPGPAIAIETALSAADAYLLDRTEFYIFSHTIVLSLFVGFLLPIWSLSFATQGLGGERDGETLVWLLTRPLPRWAIYLAKFLAVLPWCLALNLGGFALLCLLAGWPGRAALPLYWPAVAGGTLAFAALFFLFGACLRRAAVVALVYAFFLESFLGAMPGYMKRVSIGAISLAGSTV